MEEPRALTPLLAILRASRKYYPRIQAIRALGKLEDKRAIEPLEDTLNEISSADGMPEKDRSRLAEAIKQALQDIHGH
jgi:HEAT repeat protein